MKRARILIILLACLVIPAATSFAAAEKDWTWMVFINADNNLDEFGILDQDEMATVGSNEWLNIVTLIDRYDGPASYNFIEKKKVTPLRDLGEVDMGDWRQLTAFVKESIERFPAKHYSLVIWNHGSGWKKPGDSLVKGISYDDHSNNHITTAQLGEAMGEIKRLLGRNLDLLCMDACLMQMMEVAWALRQSCDYIVASEENIPAEGYPYHAMLGSLEPGMPIPEFGKRMTKAYYDCYNHDAGGYGGDDLVGHPRRDVRKTTLSMVDCSRLDSLKEALDGFAGALMAGSFASPLKSALKNVQCFSTSANIDLLHLVQLLREEIKDAPFQQAAMNLEQALKAAIPSSHATGYNPGGSDETPWPMPIDANGLAIYFPAMKFQFEGKYLELAFARDSLWDELLADFYAKSRAREIIEELAVGRFDGLQGLAAGAGNEPGNAAGNRFQASQEKALVRELQFHLLCEQSPVNGSSAARAELLRSLSRLQAR